MFQFSKREKERMKNILGYLKRKKEWKNWRILMYLDS